MRAVAALMVMAVHFSLDWWPRRFMMFGQTGVDLFFVLSGFLITMILLQARHGSWHEMRDFYIRRTLRIFPLYYGFLILSVIAGSGVSLWYWLYAQNIAPFFTHSLAGPGHFWSLAVEEQFYLVWPFVVLFLPRRLLVRALWSGIAISLALRIALGYVGLNIAELPVGRLDGLCAGALLASWYRNGSLASYRLHLKVGAVVGLITLVAEWWFTHGLGVEWVQDVKYCSTALLYGSLVGLTIATSSSPIHQFLRSRAMRAIGRVSYGMYVFHPPIFRWLPPRLGHMPLLLDWAVCVATTYLVAVASFYGIERHLTGLRSHFVPERIDAETSRTGHPEISMRPVQAGDVLA